VSNIFGDAANAGYEPVAILGDLEPFDCSLRDLLLGAARWIRGPAWYAAGVRDEPEAICDDMLRRIAAVLDAPSARPRMVWCYVDADRAFHEGGYDGEALRFLRLVDDLAVELARRTALVVAHSDHGLTPTRHDPAIAEAIDRISAEHGCLVGGAGRMRWIYTRPADEDGVAAALTRHLPRSVRICLADEIFRKGSLARSRVGDVVLIAEGVEFITQSGHGYEHGSSTDDELYVPFARWEGA